MYVIKQLNEIAYYYNKEPKDSTMVNKVCECCGKPLTGSQKKFCSSSCAAKINNKKRYIPRYCKYCGKELPKGNKKQQFCDNKCQQNFVYQQRVRQWLSGEQIAKTGPWGAVPKFIKRYLFEKYNSKCCLCGWGEINPYTGTIPLEIDHIDGNSENNVESNLRLICPNCHSLTSTYRGANRGHGRNISWFKKETAS